MKLKRWPYWLKGGIIAPVVLIVIGYIFEAITGNGLPTPNWLDFLPDIANRIIEPLFCRPLQGADWPRFHCILYPTLDILILAELVVLGGILGWLYGKIKNCRFGKDLGKHS